MAQLIFEPFNDNQTALAVQSLLESQNISESIAVDDDDLFQCGKCKKEFTNLMSFLSHKQGQCLGEVTVNANVTSQPLTIRTSMDLSNSNGSIVYTTHLGHAITKQLNAYGGVSLSSLMPGMVLGDEIISFHTVDPSSTIPLSSAIQNGGSYLSQVDPMTLSVKGNSCPTIYSTIGEPTFSASAGDFAGVIDSSQLQFQQVTTPSSESQGVELQQVIISMPQTESGVDALFSSQMHSSNSIIDPSNHDRKLRSSLDVVPAMSDLDDPLPRHGKVPIAPACTTLACGAPSEDASRRKLKCQYCDKAFLKNFDLQQHLRSHTGEKPFQCIVCGRAFAQKSNVKKHMQTHKVWPQGLSNTLPTPVILPLMSKGDVPATAALPCTLPSISDHHLQATVVDAECEKSNGGNVQVLMNCDSTTGQLFVKQWSTMISVQQDTTSDGEKVNVVVDNSYICQYCGSKFGSYFQLKSHLVIHKNEQVYKCVLKSCGDCFRELDEFLEHTKIHENEMTYRCYVCNKTFSSLYELGTHQYTHSLFPNQGPKLGPKYFRCVKCKNKYATPEALQHHLETTSHNFPCPYCSKLFTCERYLRRHLPTHGTVGEYHCEVCVKPFKTEHYLKMHMVTHSDKKPFHCDKCSRSFNRRDKLKRHLLIHDPIKKFKCPFRSVGGCTKEFNRGDKLKAHIISHTGIKPYKCKICNKFFTRRPHLREHERTHTNSFQFSCNRCGKGFRRQKLLREHVCSSGSKDSSSPDSPADCKEAIIQSIAEARGACFTRRKVISSKVAIPKRGRPPKQLTTVSQALQSDLSPSIVGIVNHQNIRNPKVESEQQQEQHPVSLSQSSSLAIASMIAIEQSSGCGNVMTIDQALDAAANSSLHGCVDGSIGSVLTLEQSADGTFYVIKPFLGKVEDLSSACLVESSSSCSMETLRTIPVMSRRSTVDDRMTILKGSRLVSGGQAAVIINSNDHIPKTEMTEGLCQVIFTDDGTTG